MKKIAIILLIVILAPTLVACASYPALYEIQALVKNQGKDTSSVYKIYTDNYTLEGQTVSVDSYWILEPTEPWKEYQHHITHINIPDVIAIKNTKTYKYLDIP